MMCRPRKTLEHRLMTKVKKGNSTDDCWIWTGARTENGYGVIRGAASRMDGAHRVSYMIHCGPVGDKHVLHKCDNRSCVNPAHLFLGTPADNMADMVAKGRQSKGPGRKGSECFRAKLKDHQVLDIRSRYARGGITYLKLAREFGVSQSLIWAITTRKVWSHLDGV